MTLPEQGGEKANKMSHEVIKLLENYGLALATNGKSGTNKQDSAVAVLALIQQEIVKAKIEVADKYLGYRAASDTEAEAIQWLDHERTELYQTLKELEAEL